MADLMENRDHWDAIAYGSYEVDIQSLDVNNKGSILMVPKQYGVPFRSLVPLNVDGLLVVGRAASFDALPHGSARVIPLGMATGEAAGAAVKLAMERGVTLRGAFPLAGGGRRTSEAVDEAGNGFANAELPGSSLCET